MRIESLTFFRFVAAFIVVVFHLGKNTALAKIAPGFFTAGPEVVTFFFVLSGFVLMLSYFPKLNFSSRKYWKSRTLRVLPGYFIALGVMFFIIQPSSPTGIAGTVLNLLLLQAWVPTSPLFLNIPGWAISVEIFFYSLFPGILMVLKKRCPKPTTLLLYALVLWVVTQVTLTWLDNSRLYHENFSVVHDLIYYFPLSHLCSFLLGIAGGYLVLKKNYNGLSKNYSALLLLLTTAATFLILEYRGAISNAVGFNLPFGASLLAPLFLIFILSLVLSKDTIFYRMLSWKPLVILGKCSYIFYIFQYPIFILCYRYLFPAIGLRTVDGTFSAYLLTLTIFSVGFYYLIEQPLKKVMAQEKIGAVQTNLITH